MITGNTGALSSSNADFQRSILDLYNERVKEIILFLTFINDMAATDTRIIAYNNTTIEDADFNISTNSDDTLDHILTKLNQKQIHSNVKNILSSSLILMLYNLVESITLKCLRLIHTNINSENLHFNEAIEEIQKIWLDNQDKVLKSQKKPMDLPTIVSALKTIIDNATIELPIASEEKGGNISGNELVNITRTRYKLYTNEPIFMDHGIRALNKTKDDRNHLAHGNKSFVGVGTSYIIGFSYNNVGNNNYTENLQNNTIRCMEEFLGYVEGYIERKGYKNS
jgi:hypothetical protein